MYTPCRRSLRGVARQFGGQAGLFVVAARYDARWMSVPASAVVKARLLADEAGDGFGIANAAWHAGLRLVRSGHPNDALKSFQLGQFVLAGFQPGKLRPAILRADDPWVPTLAGRLNRNSATAYALMDHPEQAKWSAPEVRRGLT